MSGINFAAYSYAMWAIGRTAMHQAVRDTIVDAYAELAETTPDAWFVYGESGWPWGGSFAPHKTHKNGTSVDFFVPVRDMSGNATSVPVWPWNWMGYEVRFDQNGRRPGMSIDFEAMARHLDALLRVGAARGVGIKRVILEADLHRKMSETPTGKAVAGRIAFTHRAWVPHDNHYHIDFDVQCGK
jgi:penicillin-insensitive murein endopeptidase